MLRALCQHAKHVAFILIGILTPSLLEKANKTRQRNRRTSTLPPPAAEKVFHSIDSHPHCSLYRVHPQYAVALFIIPSRVVHVISGHDKSGEKSKIKQHLVCLSSVRGSKTPLLPPACFLVLLLDPSNAQLLTISTWQKSFHPRVESLNLVNDHNKNDQVFRNECLTPSANQGIQLFPHDWRCD